MLNLTKPYVLLVALILIGLYGKAVNVNNVKISGTSLDMKDNSISVRSLNTFYNDTKMSYLATERNQTGKFSLTFKLKKPELVIFSAFFRNWFVNIRPGDSLTFKIVGKDMGQQLEFFGKNASSYNFDVLVSVEVDRGWRIPKTKDLSGYKNLLDQWKKNSEDLVNSYLAKHNVNKDIAEAGRNRINYQYVKSIYYYKNYQNLQGIIPSGYLDQANKYSFKNDNALHLNEYQSAIYYKYISDVPSHEEQPIKFAYQQIQSKLKGKTKEFALSFLTGEYSKKGSPTDSLMLRQIFIELYAKKLDTPYLAYLKDNEMRYFIVGKPLPRNVLENTFVSDYGNSRSLSLTQLLEIYRGKAVYLDLWASWCAPCRSDIAASSEIKKLLLDKGVAVVYLSTDTDEAAWKKASKQDEITEHQFRFDNSGKGNFTSFIGLDGIPRYVLLDKNHHVKTLYAPRPYSIDKRAFEKLIDEMNSSK